MIFFVLAFFALIYLVAFALVVVFAIVYWLGIFTISLLKGLRR